VWCVRARLACVVFVDFFSVWLFRTLAFRTLALDDGRRLSRIARRGAAGDRVRSGRGDGDGDGGDDDGDDARF